MHRNVQTSSPTRAVPKHAAKQSRDDRRHASFAHMGDSIDQAIGDLHNRRLIGCLIPAGVRVKKGVVTKALSPEEAFARPGLSLALPE